MGDSERIRALEQKRERVLEELERTLLDDWDTVSAVLPPPLPVPMVAPVQPESPAKQLLSNETKRTIAVVALFLGGLIAATLRGLS